MDLITCEYVLRVRFMLECPNCSWTILGLISFESSRVATVCRRSWKRIFGSPVSLITFLKCVITLRYSTGVPTLVVKTKPQSFSQRSDFAYSARRCKVSANTSETEGGSWIKWDWYAWVSVSRCLFRKPVPAHDQRGWAREAPLPFRALRPAVSSPLISVPFKITRLAQKASRVDSSRGAEIWTRDLTDPNQFQKFWTVVHMVWWFS